ncbi:MAG: Acetyl-CoA carboxylase biotin carboxylase subunit [Bacteriovoracaceae bacterium]|nr:Acetyl-CoA carboxylase biotin carboxylase subunit [Bacteriovoracaceae bacterium]
MKKPLFKKVLVANRGEIAIRILRTAREMGIKTVAIYSEADRDSLHVGEADESVCVGPAESQKSYLSASNILSAAKKLGVDAIHPGYGFLSENAGFANEVIKAGMTFIGPDPKSIEGMGDKVIARKTVEANGVPTAPGTGALENLDEALKSVTSLLKTRPDFKFPLLIKASGGGGGKGMRIIHKESELKEGLERAQSESLKAFNNPVIFVERYLEKARHIEVQVLGDGKNILHLFERECSLQRRHQKVIEEAQSPSLTPELRAKILKAGIEAAKSVNYKSAGTVEFIVSEQDEFYFLEMNTRIQVEHPVTEWITGVDLVREQFRIAAGEKLNISQEDIKSNGHSIEARLYAEDPDHDFLPQPGNLHFLRFPYWTGVRVDPSVQSPSVISSFYDPMIAKVSAWAPTREDATERLRLFLSETQVEGLISNRAFLIEILESEFFKKGRYHTQLLQEKNWRKTKAPSAKILATACLKDHLQNQISIEARPLSTWQESLSALET